MSNVVESEKQTRLALVIGGARGLGLGCARALKNDGWSVVVADKDLSKDHDFDFSGFPVDVSSAESVQSMFESVKSAFGPLDAIISTAGFTKQAPTESVSDEDWDNMLSVHLGGSFKVARAGAQFISEAGGAIVFFSSIAGAMGLPYRASYCASKAGIEGLTRSLAVEYAEKGIRVNAVAPGWIHTGLIEKDLDSGLVSEPVLRTRISLRRLGSVEEVAPVVSFLCSPGANYITGQTIAVDGGLSIDLDPGDRRAALAKMVQN